MVKSSGSAPEPARNLVEGVSVAKKRNTFAKRQREMAKKRKAEEKRERRWAKKEPTEDPEDVEATVDT